MPNFIDLTGKQFNELTVIEYDKELSREKHKTYWKCKCSCGREKSVRADGLKKIITCGECTKDLTGQIFGRLTVLQKGKKDKAQHQYYICQCECGNIVEINSDNLRRGLTKSCGCLHKEITHKNTFHDLMGQKFNKLTCISYFIENNKTYWKCKCDCGNYTTVAASNLINNHTTSCGCNSYSIGEQNIINILKNNNIDYIKEYIFKDLPNRRYDFYLPQYNRLIEFDGKQHTQLGGWNNEVQLQQLQQRDKEKNLFALQNNIDLIRIPYYERDFISLEMILGNKYKVLTEEVLDEEMSI